MTFGSTWRATWNAVSMYPAPRAWKKTSLASVAGPAPVMFGVWKASFTTSQMMTFPLKWFTRFVMWFVIAEEMSDALVRFVTHVGSCLPQTRVWPFTFMLFCWAKVTI